MKSCWNSGLFKHTTLMCDLCCICLSCDYHVAIMWLSCGYHVTHVTIMWLSCGYHVTIMWLSCDDHVTFVCCRPRRWHPGNRCYSSRSRGLQLSREYSWSESFCMCTPGWSVGRYNTAVTACNTCYTNTNALVAFKFQFPSCFHFHFHPIHCRVHCTFWIATWCLTHGLGM